MMNKALYIHIPFCDHICFYCDFTKTVASDDVKQQYIRQLINELNTINDTAVDTIYIGGGTPSSLSGKQIEPLLQALQKFKGIVEFTIELNPESVTLDKLLLYRHYGINRLSLGVQTTSNVLLKDIGRKHTFETIQQVTSLLKKTGFNNVSYDLMYGLPQQTLADVIADVNKLLTFAPPHLSLYSLTIEKNTLFGIKKVKPVAPDLETEMYLAIQGLLLKHDFKQYEISNFALANYESKHNKHYWQYDDFYGIGLGASGKINQQRYLNTLNLKTYLADFNQKEEVLNLSSKEQMEEFLMMNFRLKDGFTLQEFENRFNHSLFDLFAEVIIKNQQKGFIEINDYMIKASETGRLMMFDWLVDFID